MKKLLTLLTIISLTITLSGQEEAPADTLWKFDGLTSINLSQLSFTNWAAGGDNSISGNALLNFSADYANGPWNWDNALMMGFGLIRQGNDPLRKSDDNLNLSSKFGYKASESWFYTGLLSFRTQFAQGYDDPSDDNRMKISNFMSPGYLSLSLGMDYKPFKSLSVMLSPITSKFTFVLDEELSQAGSFGLDPGQKVRSELGGYIKIAFKKEILKNVKLNTRADFFSNYLHNPQNIDVNWDLILTMKINDYLSASLQTQLIYDDDILIPVDSNGDGIIDSRGPRIQFKQLLGIGLTYQLSKAVVAP